MDEAELLAWFELEEEEEQRLLLAAVILLGIINNQDHTAAIRAETRLYLTRPSLLHNPRSDTPWTILFNRQDTRGFITTMGLDPATFNYLLGFFEPVWNTTPVPRYDVSRTGVPRLNARSLDAAGGLGLILHYLNSTMKEATLSQIFALIPSTVSRYLDFALSILSDTLQEIPEAVISYPEEEEKFAALAERVTNRHPLLEKVFGSLDGLKVPVGASDNPLVENQNYNGWLHSHFCSNIFLFSSEGLILACVLNAPGSWHDSRVCIPVYQKLLDNTPPGYAVAADTAFKRGIGTIDGRIKTPLKGGAVLPVDRAEADAILRYSRQVTSFRQTAEWGMRTLQASFSRLKTPLDANDSGKQAKILSVIARLHNLRTARVGRNEIATTYSPEWQEDQEHRDLWGNIQVAVYGEVERRDRVARFHVIAVDE